MAALSEALTEGVRDVASTAAAPGAARPGTLDKAPGAFRTIREVAEELGVPQHVLRFWESRFGQVRPLKRAGGRRYYRPEDVDLLRRIQRLLYQDGYTIRGVQKLFRENGTKAVRAATASPASGETKPLTANVVLPPPVKSSGTDNITVDLKSTERQIGPDLRAQLEAIAVSLESALALLRQ